MWTIETEKIACWIAVIMAPCIAWYAYAESPEISMVALAVMIGALIELIIIKKVQTNDIPQ